jgi:hypothetical protein
MKQCQKFSKPQKKGMKWVLLYTYMYIYVFIYWTLWRKTLRVIFLVNDYKPALKDSMIPCKCSSLVFFLVGDTAASEFCTDVSEHSVCSIFIRPMKMEHSVIRNVFTKFGGRRITQKKEYNNTIRWMFLSYLRLLHFMCPKRRDQGLATSATGQWTKTNKRKERVYFVIWE